MPSPPRNLRAMLPGAQPAVVDGRHLTIEDVVAVGRHRAAAALDDAARLRMEQTHAVVVEALAAEASVYGLTTGVAERKRVRLGPDERHAWNRQLLRSHRVAQGPPASDELVRSAMVVLANSLATGAAGVRPAVVEAVIAALAQDRMPAVRTLGSVGQADLGPMADLAEGVVGDSALELEPGEALALLNNNAFAVGAASLAVHDAELLLASLDVAAALDLEAFAGNVSPYHPAVAEARPHPGLRRTIERMGGLLEGSFLYQPGAARNLQDPLTFRCVPQIHGAARDALAYARATVQTELNSSQGNPIVVLSERRVQSAGNFDVGPVAGALDFARLAMSPVVAAAAERAVKLLQAPLSGLSSGLAVAPETGDDGLAELAVAVQAVAVEARSLAHPVSADLVSTSKAEGIEDRATNAPLAARRLGEMTGLVARVAAIELVIAAQAVDLRGSSPLGRGTRQAHAAIRERVASTGRNDTLPADLEPVVELVASGYLARLDQAPEVADPDEDRC